MTEEKPFEGRTLDHLNTEWNRVMRGKTSKEMPRMVFLDSDAYRGFLSELKCAIRENEDTRIVSGEEAARISAPIFKVARVYDSGHPGWGIVFGFGE